MVKPDQILSIRKDGQGNILISVKPERFQEVADAVFLLMQQNPLKSKSEAILDSLVRLANMIEEDPAQGEFLRQGDD